MDRQETAIDEDMTDSKVFECESEEDADNAHYFHPVIKKYEVEGEKSPQDEERKNPFMDETGSDRVNKEKKEVLELIQLQEIKQKLNSIIANMAIERKYNVTYQRRGIALIFNILQFDPKTELNDRDGTDLDEIYFKQTLRVLGFAIEDTIAVRNPTTKEIIEHLERVAKMQIHENSDMFLCAFFSHGDKNKLYSSDGDFNPSLLWENFTDDKCPGLKGKPKIFIVQACRGVKLDEGFTIHPKLSERTSSPLPRSVDVLDIADSKSYSRLTVPTHRRTHSYSDSEFPPKPSPTHNRLRLKRESLPGTITQIPVEWLTSSDDSRRKSDVTDANINQPDEPFNLPHFEPDVLVAYSTVDGYYSFRRPNEGSWFIRDLCETLTRQYHSNDLVSMLTEVNLKVALERESVVRDVRKKEFDQKKQVPCFNSTLTKLLYFTPDSWSTRL